MGNIANRSITDSLLRHDYLLYIVGPFLLTHLLLDKLKASAPSRIINTSALAHKLGVMQLDDINFESREFKPGDAYAQSKLAVMLYTRQLAKEIEGESSWKLLEICSRAELTVKPFTASVSTPIVFTNFDPDKHTLRPQHAWTSYIYLSEFQKT